MAVEDVVKDHPSEGIDVGFLPSDRVQFEREMEEEVIPGPVFLMVTPSCR